MQIIDITHPQLPFPVSTVQIDGSTYALVASNKDHGFTILNMDNPESPSIVFNTTSTHANYSAIHSILGASPIQIQGNTYVVTISASSKILIADIKQILPHLQLYLREATVLCIALSEFDTTSAYVRVFISTSSMPVALDNAKPIPSFMA